MFRSTRISSSCPVPLAVFAAVSAMVAWASPVNDAATSDIERQVDNLIDQRFTVREKASERLWELGRTALPRLRELTESPDPEQAVRARELVRKIEMGLFPDSDPELLEIVARYASASDSEKNDLIRDLQNKRAWRQMLKLHQEETSAALRRQYQDAMQRVAVLAAREKICKGDNNEGLELLQMAPVTPESLLALAEYHRANGTLEAELHKAADQPGVEAAAWRCALQRSADNLEAAIAEAYAAKQDGLAAALSVMNGNPLPWLDQMSQDPEEEEARRLSDQVRTLYARMAASRWRGEAMDPATLAKLRDMLQNRSSHYRRCARTALFMLGQTDVAEASLLKDSPVYGLQHLVVLERVEEALKILGLSVDEPCTEAWVGSKFKNLGVEDLDELDRSDSAQSLHFMAGLLESRGLHQLAVDCFLKPAREYAKREEAGFLEFLRMLMSEGEGFFPAPLLAIDLAADWAGEDDKRWATLADMWWSGDGSNQEWWELTEKLKPRSSRAERMRAVMVLLGRIPGRPGERHEWLDLAWKLHQKGDEDEKIVSIKRLADLAFRSGDVELGVRTLDDMPDEMREGYYWRQRVAHLSANNNWDEVCSILLQQIDTANNSDGTMTTAAGHAYAAGALRQAGRHQEAKSHDRQAELLALGDSSTAAQIASAYAFTYDFERSKIWWRRAALYSTPDSGLYSQIIANYAITLQNDPTRWQLLAAMQEVVGSQAIDSSYYDQEFPLMDMHTRLKADTFRALSRLQDQPKQSLALLEECHRNYANDGVLADYFFPALRLAGLHAEHDRWFAQSWQKFEKVISEFPGAHNTRNTAAWFASRAQRELKRALEFQQEALKSAPEQPAYLDTMAEIHFAMGRRADATKWSRKAILLDPADGELRRQFHHFANDPLPK